MLDCFGLSNTKFQSCVTITTKTVELDLDRVLTAFSKQPKLTKDLSKLAVALSTGLAQLASSIETASRYQNATAAMKRRRTKKTI